MSNSHFDPNGPHWWEGSSSNRSKEDLNDNWETPSEISWHLARLAERELHAQACKDFPKAIDPEEWYKYPPIEAGAPKPFRKTRLGKLPLEVRHILFNLITSHGDSVPLSTHDNARALLRRRRYRGLWNPHCFLRGLENIMGVCLGLRSETQDHIMTSTIHVCDRASEMGLICQIYGSDSMKIIRDLTMDIEEIFGTRPRNHFSNLLEILSKELANLVRFQLRSPFGYDDSALPARDMSTPDYPNTTRDQQEIRTLLQFGAFLVLRHKNLDLLIWPADSSKKWRGDDAQPVMYIDVVSKSFKRASMKVVLEAPTEGHESVMVEDRILNATKIRHTLWKDIAALGVNVFSIDAKSTSSEVPEGHRCFKRVDMEAYITEARREDLGDPEYIPVDGLIRMGQKHLESLQSRRQGHIEGCETSRGEIPQRGRGSGRGRGRGSRFGAGNTGETNGARGRGAGLNAGEPSRGSRGRGRRGNRGGRGNRGR